MTNEEFRELKGKFDPLALIDVLEKHLAGSPVDTESYYRLGRLYEFFARDDRAAKRNYLQHLIRTMGHDCVDAAEAAMRDSAANDPTDAMAHIHLGHIYGYQDRFDEAVRELQTGTVWSLHETEHFALHSIPVSTADLERDRIASVREESYVRIVALFGLGDDVPEPVRYFFYESRLHKGLLTGDQEPAHAFPGRREVHAVYGLGRKVVSPHEDTHILLGGLGRPVKLLEEGAAEFAHHGGKVHEWYLKTRDSYEPGTVSALLDDTCFSASDLFASYPLAASFVCFLVGRGGIAAFKHLYGTPAARIRTALRRLYGAGVHELEREWQAMLGFDLPAPGGDGE